MIRKLAVVCAVGIGAVVAVLTPMGSAHAAGTCGVTAADYNNSTYIVDGGGKPDSRGQQLAPIHGRIDLSHGNVSGVLGGTWTADADKLTLTVSGRGFKGTYVSTFRGCEADSTKPGFVSLRSTSIGGQPFPPNFITLARQR